MGGGGGGGGRRRGGFFSCILFLAHAYARIAVTRLIWHLAASLRSQRASLTACATPGLRSISVAGERSQSSPSRMNEVTLVSKTYLSSNGLLSLPVFLWSLRNGNTLTSWRLMEAEAEGGGLQLCVLTSWRLTEAEAEHEAEGGGLQLCALTSWR